MGRRLHQISVYFGLSRPSREEAEHLANYRDDLRRRIRTLRYWLALATFITLCMAVTFEAFSWSLGDGRFDGSEVMRWFAVLFVSVSVVRLFEAIGPK